MTPTDAAELLERVAIGSEGDTRERVVARILSEPDYALEVLEHALDPENGEETRLQLSEAAKVLELEQVVDVTRCGAIAAYCVCGEPLGHVAAGRPSHVCNEEGCGGEWIGELNGPDFRPITLPGRLFTITEVPR